MKKNIMKILCVCIVVALAFLYAHIDKNSYLYNRNADSGVFINTGVLLEGEEISQTFVSDENTIDGVNLKVSIVGKVDEAVLKCAVVDNETLQITESSVKVSDLENNKFNKIKLPEIKNTKDKQFTLVLSVENTDEQQGLSFYYDPSLENSEQKLSVRGNEETGTIVARVICHRFDVETFVVLLGIIMFITVFLKVLYKLFK